MDKKQVIALAREAGGLLPDPMVFIAAYERFFQAAYAAGAAAEREECAKLAEQTKGTAGANYLIAKAIRARGNT